MFAKPIYFTNISLFSWFHRSHHSHSIPNRKIHSFPFKNPTRNLLQKLILSSWNWNLQGSWNGLKKKNTAGWRLLSLLLTISENLNKLHNCVEPLKIRIITLTSQNCCCHQRWWRAKSLSQSVAHHKWLKLVKMPKRPFPFLTFQRDVWEINPILHEVCKSIMLLSSFEKVQCCAKKHIGSCPHTSCHCHLGSSFNFTKWCKKMKLCSCTWFPPDFWLDMWLNHLTSLGVRDLRGVGRGWSWATSNCPSRSETAAV